MPAEAFFIQEHLALLVNGPEVEQDASLYKALREPEELAVMEVILGLYDFLHSGEKRLWREGNEDGSVVVFCVRGMADAVFPFSV